MTTSRFHKKYKVGLLFLITIHKILIVIKMINNKSKQLRACPNGTFRKSL